MSATHTHTHTHTCTHTHTPTQIHTRTHTHKHTPPNAIRHAYINSEQILLAIHSVNFSYTCTHLNADFTISTISHRDTKSVHPRSTQQHDGRTARLAPFCPVPWSDHMALVRLSIQRVCHTAARCSHVRLRKNMAGGPVLHMHI